MNEERRRKAEQLRKERDEWDRECRQGIRRAMIFAALGGLAYIAWMEVTGRTPRGPGD